MQMDSEEHDLLRQRWAANETPIQVVDEAIREATGSPPRRVKRLLVSYSNDVYEAIAEDGRELIVRVHAHGEPGYFGRERWALERCREAGIPVPIILSLIDDERDGTRRSIAVQTKLPGAPMDRANAGNDLAPGVRGRLVEQAGALLRVVHSVGAVGFGVIDDAGTASCSSWSSLTDRFDTRRLVDLADSVALDPDLVRAALERLRSGVSTHDAGPTCLLHGDFAPKHILVEDERVTGIIDFEFARSGYPAADLAFWHYGGPETFEHLIAGYGVEPDPELLLLHSLDISLSYLDYHGPRGELRGEFREQVAQRLAEDAAAI